MALEKTYEMDRSVPCNMTNVEYRHHVMKNWQTILNDSTTDEKNIQKFMETHPGLMPFTERPLTQGNNHALSKAIVTQPILPGLKTKIPDFMYFAGNSGEVIAVLVEIECPKKKWFTQAGQPTQQLTQAANQITTWKTWFSDPANIQIFERDYMVRGYGNLNDRVFRQEYILVIGRRSDITDPNLKRSRSSLQRPSETWMTYDRLNWSFELEEAVTVGINRKKPTQYFEALHVPPTFKLGPCHYPNYHRISEIEAAISSNDLISESRRKFLLDRIPYWRNWWTTAKGPVTINGMDFSGE